MQLDDFLEGDVKFYKDAKDFLKRAKEVQAGGTAYAGFDINDTLSAKIKETVGYNGAKQEIKFGNTTIDKYANAYSPVEGYAIIHSAGKYARNGFRAVTINNTVRPSKQANNIQQELFNYLKDELGEVAATKKAAEIANGYREASKLMTHNLLLLLKNLCVDVMLMVLLKNMKIYFNSFMNLELVNVELKI